MATILHIDASPRLTRSLSRDLSRNFIETWQQHRPDDTFIRRDIGETPPPGISERFIAAAFTKPEKRTPEQRAQLAYSDMLVDELVAADLVVLATPMHNYGMPSALKCWVDQVIRIGRTFSFDLARGDFPLEPILGGKTMVLLTAAGEFGFEPGGARAGMNHLVPHIETVKHYLGIDDVHHVGIEYQEFGGERHAQSIANAHASIAPLVERLLPALANFEAA